MGRKIQKTFTGLRKKDREGSWGKKDGKRRMRRNRESNECSCSFEIASIFFFRSSLFATFASFLLNSISLSSLHAFNAHSLTHSLSVPLNFLIPLFPPKMEIQNRIGITCIILCVPSPFHSSCWISWPKDFLLVGRKKMEKRNRIERKRRRELEKEEERSNGVVSLDQVIRPYDTFPSFAFASPSSFGFPIFPLEQEWRRSHWKRVSLTTILFILDRYFLLLLPPHLSSLTPPSFLLCLPAPLEVWLTIESQLLTLSLSLLSYFWANNNRWRMKRWREREVRSLSVIEMGNKEGRMRYNNTSNIRTSHRIARRGRTKRRKGEKERKSVLVM